MRKLIKIKGSTGNIYKVREKNGQYTCECKSFPDGYILGVECDGRAYHSSRSQRDNDILRQSVLEDQGWKIYRIWSTDWFHDPQKELNKLDREIKKLI